VSTLQDQLHGHLHTKSCSNDALSLFTHAHHVAYERQQRQSQHVTITAGVQQNMAGSFLLKLPIVQLVQLSVTTSDTTSINIIGTTTSITALAISL
jgi:hypothetical protein